MCFSLTFTTPLFYYSFTIFPLRKQLTFQYLLSREGYDFSLFPLLSPPFYFYLAGIERQFDGSPQFPKFSKPVCKAAAEIRANTGGWLSQWISATAAWLSKEIASNMCLVRNASNHFAINEWKGNGGWPYSFVHYTSISGKQGNNLCCCTTSLKDMVKCYSCALLALQPG